MFYPARELLPSCSGFHFLTRMHVMATTSRHTPAQSTPARPPSARSTPAEAAESVNLGPWTPPRSGPTEDEIRARAHALWEQAGRPDGDGVQFWLEAEKELKNPR